MRRSRASEFRVGDRVQLSDLGRLDPRIVDRTGRIVGVSKRGACVRVLWDGLRSAVTYDHSSIAPESPPTPMATVDAARGRT